MALAAGVRTEEHLLVSSKPNLKLDQTGRFLAGPAPGRTSLEQQLACLERICGN
jgi:hypothetical protein